MSEMNNRMRAQTIMIQQKNIEFLPVMLLDHHSKPLASYFILHPVPALGRGSFDRATAEGSMDPALPVIKVRSFDGHSLVRRDLAQAMTAEGFTGIRWVEVEDYKSSGRI
jgi:hypothetical protein